MYYSIALGFALVAAIVSAIGAAVYLVWSLSWPAVILVAALSATTSFFVLRYIFSQLSNRGKTSHEAKPWFRSEGFSLDGTEVSPPENSRLWFLGLIPFTALIVVCFVMLVRSQTDAAMNTPWKEVPQIFWIALALAAAGGAALLMRAKAGLTWLVTLGLIGAGVSVAAIVYRLGYGYDPFVHQAAEGQILSFGFIAPKTPYYAGQYALAVLIARFSGAPVHVIDVWLLPSLAALGISGAIGFAARAAKANIGAWGAGFLAVLPLAPFINTTPFGLASLYCLLAAITALGTRTTPRLKAAVWIFAVAALMTHPIAGVPAVVFAAIVQFKKYYVRIVIAVAGVVALPVLFAVSAKGFSFSWERISTITIPFELPLTRFHALGDPLYAIGALAAVIIIVSACTNYAYLIAAASAALSGVMVAASIDFSYLPDSEQGGYAARLLTVALLLAAPAAAVAIAKLIEKTYGKPWRNLAAIAAVAFFFTGGVYLAYPRVDSYVISKGWNTSATDVSVVHAIAADANGAPYIVLSAQPVSAAALKEFGFFRYFETPQGQVFAYPVPTGGPLYQFYLKMIYDEPSSEYMKQAMDLAGVKRGYFVVNSYWTRADHIINRAQQTSEKWFGIDNADYVFRYSR